MYVFSMFTMYILIDIQYSLCICTLYVYVHVHLKCMITKMRDFTAKVFLFLSTSIGIDFFQVKFHSQLIIILEYLNLQ